MVLEEVSGAIREVPSGVSSSFEEVIQEVPGYPEGSHSPFKGS